MLDKVWRGSLQERLVLIRCRVFISCLDITRLLLLSRQGKKYVAIFVLSPMESPRTSLMKSNIHESYSSARTADNDPSAFAHPARPGQRYQNQASFWSAIKYFLPSVDTKKGIQRKAYNNSFLRVPSISRKRTGRLKALGA